MREITRIIRRRRSFFNRSDSYNHMWFNYHRLFFGWLIHGGKKIKALNKFLKIKYFLKKSEGIDPYLTFLVAMIRITPAVYLRPLGRRGFSQGVPLPITEKKRSTFAVKWIMKVAKKKKKSMSAKVLADLLILSVYNKGPVISLKRNTYNIARMSRHLLRFFK